MVRSHSFQVSICFYLLIAILIKADEREALLKAVLPKLQEWCKARGVFLTSVDLRWGITSEDTNTGNSPLPLFYVDL